MTTNEDDCLAAVQQRALARPIKGSVWEPLAPGAGESQHRQDIHRLFVRFREAVASVRSDWQVDFGCCDKNGSPRAPAGFEAQGDRHSPTQLFDCRGIFLFPHPSWIGLMRVYIDLSIGLPTDLGSSQTVKNFGVMQSGAGGESNAWNCKRELHDSRDDRRHRAPWTGQHHHAPAG